MTTELPPVAIAQHNPTVGDVSGNRDAILDGLERADDAGAAVVVTPELALLGYPPRDLLHRESVLAAERDALDTLQEATVDGPAVVVGHTAASDSDEGPPLVNGASVFADGERRATYAKQLLPTYDVFDEHRYFCRGESPTTVDIGGATVGVTICEDAWHDHAVTGQQRHGTNPIAEYDGVDLLVNLSASPFHVGKPSKRLERFRGHAAAVDAPVVFANQVGGNDDILFDGTSFVVDDSGTAVATSPLGESDVVVERWDGAESATTVPTEIEQLRRMLALGIRDYLRKTGFEEVVVGLSGGIDSSVAAALATEALGPEHVYGVTLPSHVTAEQNRSDAERVARNLGIRFGERDIEAVASESIAAIDHLTDGDVAGIARENAQARVRGLILMGVANDTGALVLTPDNNS
jgi:predicted amidohydrolase